jgi:hypothetical protein
VVRTFTLEEANALVPRVARVLARTTQLLGRLRRSVKRFAEAGLGRAEGGLPDESALRSRPELLEELAVARMVADAVRDEARSLEALGLVVRDVQRGLVDFRSIVDGEREVFLCWQLGERDIRFFHELSSGFSGRQSIEGHQFFRSRQLRAPSD